MLVKQKTSEKEQFHSKYFSRQFIYMYIYTQKGRELGETYCNNLRKPHQHLLIHSRTAKHLEKPSIHPVCGLVCVIYRKETFTACRTKPDHFNFVQRSTPESPKLLLRMQGYNTTIKILKDTKSSRNGLRIALQLNRIAEYLLLINRLSQNSPPSLWNLCNVHAMHCIENHWSNQIQHGSKELKVQNKSPYPSKFSIKLFLKSSHL